MVKAALLTVLLLVANASPVALAEPCRPVSHALGSSCVSPEPKRVAVLDTGELDIVLALGVEPIAATTPYQVGQFPAYLQIDDDRLLSLGVVQEPDLERLMRLKPDVIMGSQQRHGQLYPILSSIAPTVFSESLGASWAENLQLFAGALGREAVAERLLADIDEQCRQIWKQYRAKGQPRLSIIRSMQTHVRLPLGGSFIGSLVQRCGLLRPDAQSGTGFDRRLRSPRHIDMLDGDIILLSEYAPEQGSLIQRWQRSPFWSRLTGQVHEVDDSYWMLGIGPVAAKRVLNDLQRIIASYSQRLQQQTQPYAQH